MANRNGMDLGKVLRNNAEINSIRQNTAINKFNLEQSRQNLLDKKQNKNSFLAMSQEATNGGIEAKKRLLAKHPVEGETLIKNLKLMNDDQKQQVQDNINKVGLYSAFVLKGKTEDERRNRYHLMVSQLPKNVQAKMPKEYKKSFLELSIQKSKLISDVFKNPVALNIGDEGYIYKGNELLQHNKTIKYNKDESGKVVGNGKSSIKLKPIDQPYITKLVNGLTSAILDQDNKSNSFNNKLENKKLAITTEAVKLFNQARNNQSPISESDAVSKAALKFGFRIPGVPKDFDNKKVQYSEDIDLTDPFSIKNTTTPPYRL